MTTKKKLLITGSTGFIGQRLLLDINPDLYEVHVVVRPTSERPLSLPANQIHIFNGETEHLVAIMSCIRPHTVIHLATNYFRTYESPDINALFQTNIWFGQQLLEAMRLAKVDCLINAGSFVQHHDNKPYKAVNLYAATKQAFQSIIDFYNDTYKIKALTLDIGAVYGPDEPSSKIISTMLRSLQSKELIELSPGEQWLPLIHVNDISQGILAGLSFLESRADNFIGSLSLSPEKSYQLKSIATLLETLTHKTTSIKWGALPYGPHPFLTPWQPQNRLPGWEPKISLEEGMMNMLTNESNFMTENV